MSFYGRKRTPFPLLISLLILVSGCSASKTVFHKPIQHGNRHYDVVEIPDFAKTSDAWVPYDSSTVIPDMVADELMANGGYEIKRIKSGGAALGGRALLLKGTVINYDPGCKYCEMFIRVNDKGKSSVAVRVKFVDSETGDVVADVEIEGRATKPGTGRSRYVRIVNEIVSLVHDIDKKG